MNNLRYKKLRSALPDIDKIKFDFDNSALHKGKILFKATEINYCYNNQFLWKDNLTFKIKSGDRIEFKGLNGSGMTTLIKIILGKLISQIGTVFRAENRSIYIDQDYTPINNQLKVYEQAQHFNTSALQEHEIKIRLNRFLFTKDDWDKSCGSLSGGEKMRLLLCYLTISNQSTDFIILDEPTNNLDIQNIEILTTVINEYEGTLILISHYETFLEQTKINQTILL